MNKIRSLIVACTCSSAFSILYLSFIDKFSKWGFTDVAASFTFMFAFSSYLFCLFDELSKFIKK